MGTTATLLVRHRVQDYGAWRAVYETVEGLRREHGCTSADVMVDPGDKQDIFVLHRFPTVTQAHAFADSNELREAMGRAGVVGAPRIEIAVEA
jgi:quinol monooxygenase YgiN